MASNAPPPTILRANPLNQLARTARVSLPPSIRGPLANQASIGGMTKAKKKRRSLTVVAAVGDVSADGTTYLRSKPFTAATSTSSMSSSSSQIIEHVVLIKVKDGTDPSRVNAMVDGLNGLISLDPVLHLTAGPVLCSRSSTSPSAFTIMLHSRYRTKDDLAAYTHHPDHTRVAKELGTPIREDIMAVDWVTDCVPEGAIALPPGSTIRVSLFKLKEGAGDEAKGEVLSAVAEGTREGLTRMEHATWGENFSPLHSKGFSIGSIAVFKDMEQMKAVPATTAVPQQEKVGKYVDGIISVDFVVQHPQPASLSL